jgi:hypothetical protein
MESITKFAFYTTDPTSPTKIAEGGSTEVDLRAASSSVEASFESGGKKPEN